MGLEPSHDHMTDGGPLRHALFVDECGHFGVRIAESAARDSPCSGDTQPLRDQLLGLTISPSALLRLLRQNRRGVTYPDEAGRG